MIRDITLGQYFPVESKIHSLDARIKILGTLIYVIGLFVINNYMGFAIAILALGTVILMSKVPIRFITKGLKPIFIIIVLTIVLNMLMTPGRQVFSWGIVKVTEEGLYMAGFMGIRLILLIFGSSLLTLTTKPVSLTDGIESLLKPFRKVGLPAHELAMMMSIALRFIPTLLEETDKIMKAQMARGADFESGNLIKRAKGIIPLLVPLFISAFRIAQDLAMAMEARCYRGGTGRTRLNGMKLKRRDRISLVLELAFLAVLIVQSHTGLIAYLR